jgi:hypothetical protein
MCGRQMSALVSVLKGDSLLVFDGKQAMLKVPK